MSLDEAFDRLLPLIEAELHDVTRAKHDVTRAKHDVTRAKRDGARTPRDGLAGYYGMMHYHLGWADEELHPVEVRGGKRLRPMLCLLSCQAAGGSPAQALPAAAAVELVHNFSLVHDDIQDGSHYRRGRRAVWDIWSAAHGINVGDGLFVLARLALHRLAEQGATPARQQAATLALDRACLSLCEGQYFDMTFEDRLDIDLDQYLGMIRQKTATLLAASTRLGALLACDDDERIEHYAAFGENLGMAFQIQDDVLGAWGDEAVTGKSAATDIRDKKKTLPVVYVLNHPGERDAARELVALYGQEGPLDARGIETALGILERAGARQYAEEMAARYYHDALEHLHTAGAENDAGMALRQLAASLLGRVA